MFKFYSITIYEGKNHRSLFKTPLYLFRFKRARLLLKRFYFSYNYCFAVLVLYAWFKSKGRKFTCEAFQITKLAIRKRPQKMRSRVLMMCIKTTMNRDFQKLLYCQNIQTRSITYVFGIMSSILPPQNNFEKV